MSGQIQAQSQGTSEHEKEDGEHADWMTVSQEDVPRAAPAPNMRAQSTVQNPAQNRRPGLLGRWLGSLLRCTPEGFPMEPES